MAVMLNHKTVIENRKKREKDRRIQGIMRAAKKIFFAKGYSKATMDEIALEAEISKPTIYQYFDTKDDLFFSLLIPVIEDIGHQVNEINQGLEAREYTSGADVIRDLFKVYYNCFEQDTDTFMFFTIFQQIGMVYELNDATRESFIQKGKYCFDQGREIARRARDQGLFREVDEYYISDFVWGAFWGIVQLQQMKPHAGDVNPNLKPTLELVENTIIGYLVIK
jgi:AcrR family transcriptional regulator